MSDVGPNAAGRARIRQILRLSSKLVQKCGTLVRNLERASDRLRDRATIPTIEQAEAVLVPRFNVVKAAFRDMEAGLADVITILGDPGVAHRYNRTP